MRRLLDRGPHTVTVTPMVRSSDSLGTSLVAAEPVTLTGVSIQPVSPGADSDSASGTVGVASWKVIGAGVWPGGPYARIRVQVGPPGLEGRDFDQVGEAAQRGVGQRTRHWAVTMAAAGLEEH